MTFPLDPAPAGFVGLSGSTRGNVYIDGETPTFTLSATITANWTVRDYYGATVATGTITNTGTITPAHPAGSWPRGWYRLYLTRPTGTDPVFGPSLGVTNFAVVANDSRFIRPGRTGDYAGGGEAADYALKGFLGMGTSRNQLGAPANLTAGQDNLQKVKDAAAISNIYWTTGTAKTGPDATRPRVQWVSFPDDVTDRAFLGGSQQVILTHASAATLAAGSITIATVAGTSTGLKMTITQGSTTEVYDNVPATVSGVVTGLAVSLLVQAYRSNDVAPGVAIAPGQSLTITNAKYAGIKQVVAEAYPLGVTWYEGPGNEPELAKNASRFANDARLFQIAVKAGNPNAKAMGPTLVDINIGSGGPGNLAATPGGGIGNLYRWLVGLGNNPSNDGPMRAAKDYLDGITVHVYNFCNGDMNLGRQTLDNFEATLTLAGVANLPRFQGEQGVITPVYGVYHPRRARWQMLHHLLLEQYGIPMERNNLWYDISHGFWGFPGWWQNGDQSIEPQAALLRVMAEETYGRPFAARLAFGAVGDRVFVGSRYTSPTDGSSVLAIAATSHLDAAATGTVTLALSSAAGAALPSTITYREKFGATTTANVTSDGLATVPVTCEPTWARIPAGITATVSTVMGLRNRDTPNLAAGASWGTFDGVTGNPKALNGAFPYFYDGSTVELATATVPASYTVRLERTTLVTDVVIFSGMAWQSHAALLDFDVQTSNDSGATWTTRSTVTRAATSFVHGSDFRNTGTQRDTFWDEAWVFPVRLASPAVANAVRLVIRAVSAGGEPDVAATTSGGQGDPAAKVCLTEVMVLGDAPKTYAAA